MSSPADVDNAVVVYGPPTKGDVKREQKAARREQLRLEKASKRRLQAPVRERNARLHVAIVGGGIGGLGLAIALAQHGIGCTVLERDVSFDARRQGYGLTLQQGQRSLRALGLVDELVRRDTPSSSHFVFNGNGTIVGFFGPRFYQLLRVGQQRVSAAAMHEQHAESATDDGKCVKKHNVHAPRQLLRRLLLDRVEALNVVQWKKQLLRYTENADTNDVVLELTDGSTLRADVLVGADGIYSSVRRQLLGVHDAPLRFLGVLVVLGIVDCIHPLFRRRILQTVDGATRIFVMPFTERGEFSDSDTVMWQLSFPLDEAEARRLSADPVLLREEALRRCGAWHAPIPELLAATTPEHICGTPVFDRDPPLETHCSARVVLIGDAAHPMSPFKGQGANQALLDAVDLAQELATRPSVAGAIREYQRQMCERSGVQVLSSRERVRRLHSTEILDVATIAEWRGINADFVTAVQQSGITAATCTADTALEDVILDLLLTDTDTVNNDERI
jgi:salicylate hydroxylase